MFGYRYYKFNLNISAEELLRVYTGSARKVMVRTYEGLNLELDANHLRKFTTKDGICGKFVLTTNAENKFISLEKIS